MAAPLILTRDEALVDALLRLAAAAGVTPEVVADPRVGLRSWLTAPLVLVGADLAPALVRLSPPRRGSVVLAVWEGGPVTVYRQALELGAQRVAELPGGETALVEVLADLVDPAHAKGVTLGVIGGCGGAGATTFACALGQLAAGAGPALLVDADPGGPGLDRVLGVEAGSGVRWEDLQQSTGRLSARALRDAVPSRGRVGVLTWRSGHPEQVPAAVVRETLSAARRGHDVVVVDLPRCGDARTEELIARVDRLVVLTAPTVPGVAATVRLCRRYPDTTRHLVMRGRGPTVVELVAATGVPVVTVMSGQRRVGERVDLGLGPLPAARGPLRRAAAEVLAAVEPLGSGA